MSCLTQNSSFWIHLLQIVSLLSKEHKIARLTQTRPECGNRRAAVQLLRWKSKGIRDNLDNSTHQNSTAMVSVNSEGVTSYLCSIVTVSLGGTVLSYKLKSIIPNKNATVLYEPLSLPDHGAKIRNDAKCKKKTQSKFKNCSNVCVYLCAQLSCTTQNSYDLRKLKKAIKWYSGAAF